MCRNVVEDYFMERVDLSEVRIITQSRSSSQSHQVKTKHKQIKRYINAVFDATCEPISIL